MNDTGAELLAEAIIRSAVHDIMYGTPRYAENAERFFRSDYFVSLTNGKVDGEAAIKVCRERKAYVWWRRTTGCPQCKRITCPHCDGDFTKEKSCLKHRTPIKDNRD